MGANHDFENDQRRHSRFDAMEYALMFPPQYDDPVPSVVTDISLGGLQVRAKQPVDEGSQFLMHISQADEDPIVTAVEVKHCSPIRPGLFAIGVRFLPGASEQRMKLVSYVHAAFESKSMMVA